MSSPSLLALRTLAAGAAAVAILGSGCASGERQSAEATVRLAARAIVDVETSGGEVPELEEAVQRAHDWLGPAETAIELWDEGGPAGYRRVAPCLGASLTEIRLALLEAGRPVPAELEQAEEQAHAAGPRPCSGGG
ncbi:MAG TPA: hypothetical protein RMH85_17180 [Polyangiaceae bacterium LLY-WYZ-15_(1-7)]|nr:hypothetical protein [Sandaracinus sp.]HJK89259.1 hypothetical protein [Polyangiaceae bacterium LLY-WYZ-15_(1-7)]HJL03040.1 hypothetical protein [Polyangiaceae bacterium LLY-WYZ-15_(1-7)]HJL10236.1 hypothetical protein [Polyangiaceae bacterium LLY-WYZ-15_(1-7)]HJL30295.1 hypothetical protein [Polyangiaceae bacterium LLY-WYZ-15_(1-7)]